VVGADESHHSRLKSGPSREAPVKRDFDLIREMLLTIEASEEFDGRGVYMGRPEEFFPEMNRPYSEMAYNFQMMAEMDLIVGRFLQNSGQFELRRLTALGHDFLDATRRPDIWERAKAAASNAGVFTAQFIVDVAKHLAMKQLTGG
jgi:hypothetical protein